MDSPGVWPVSSEIERKLKVIPQPAMRRRTLEPPHHVAVVREFPRDPEEKPLMLK
jgi:hypothetical protein